MYHLRKNEINYIPVLGVASGSPFTGLVEGDVTFHKSINGGAAVSVSPVGNWIEIDQTEFPGVYIFALPAAEVVQDGTYTFILKAGPIDNYNVLASAGLFDAVLDVRSLSGQVNFRFTGITYDGDGNLTAGTIKGYNNAADAAADTNERVELDLTTASYDVSGNLEEMVLEEQ